MIWPLYGQPDLTTQTKLRCTVLNVTERTIKDRPWAESIVGNLDIYIYIYMILKNSKLEWKAYIYAHTYLCMKVYNHM